MSKFIKAIRTLAKMKALDAENAERLLNAHVEENDGGPGSGNFGHAGRPGKKGGSAPEGGGGGSANKGSSSSSKAPAPMSYTKGKTPPLLKKAESPEGLGLGDVVKELSPNGKKWLDKVRSGEVKVSPKEALNNWKGSMNTENPRQLQKLEKQARELGYKDLDQMRRAAKGMVSPEEKKQWYGAPKEEGGMSASMKTNDPKEIQRLERQARELGYKDLDQMRRAAKGEVSPAEKKQWFGEKPDGRKNSGNWGHQANPNGGKGSGKSGTKGTVSGNAGKAKDGTVYRGKDYTLRGLGLSSGKLGPNNPGKTWESKGEKSKALPNGSGSTRISEKDVGTGLHTINRFLNADGTLKPERAALHEKIVQGMFEGKSKPGPGEQKTFYFLGGGSASGKSRFTKPETSGTYGVPDKNTCTVIDSDTIKDSLPEYNENAPTGTTDRNKAASFAHEESSALAKRAMQAAFDNGYNVTLDGTGDGGEASVMKKIDQARKAGYRVEGRYCTASIENAIKRNIERSKTQHRLVSNDSVIDIHKNVSRIFEKVAPEFDHIELWDHDGPTPVKIAECNRGQKVSVLDKKLYKKFLDKANWDGNRT